MLKNCTFLFLLVITVAAKGSIDKVRQWAKGRRRDQESQMVPVNQMEQTGGKRTGTRV